jgi:NADPH-dependent curcumin reductase CurA
MTDVNRQWRLRERPTGSFSEEHVELTTEPVPTPGEGEALVRVTHLSMDPTIRGWMQMDTYMPAIPVGDVVRSLGAGEVVASTSDRYAVGDLVSGLTGWQEYAIADEGDRRLEVLPAGTDPLVAVSLFGPSGLAAYFGMLRVGEPQEGDTVVVSGAAGATGSVAGMIAKSKGCRVIGIAGGPEKCERVVEEYGFDACVDYKADGFRAALKEAVGRGGVDVYFDNVGGRILDLVLARLAVGARVVICGAISQYDGGTPSGPANYINLIRTRSRMEGFLIFDHRDEFPTAYRDLTRWVADGTIVNRLDVSHGIEAVPTAFAKLFSGGNDGKNIVALT